MLIFKQKNPMICIFFRSLPIPQLFELIIRSYSPYNPNPLTMPIHLWPQFVIFFTTSDQSQGDFVYEMFKQKKYFFVYLQFPVMLFTVSCFVGVTFFSCLSNLFDFCLFMPSHFLFLLFRYFSRRRFMTNDNFFVRKSKHLSQEIIGILRGKYMEEK